MRCSIILSFIFIIVAIVGLNSFSYYFFGVEGRESKSSFFSPALRELPAAPMNLTAYPGDGYVLLKWNAPAYDGGNRIESYYIYRNDNRIASVSSEQMWYKDEDVKNGVTYYYYVTAVNLEGEGEKSKAVYATPISPPGPPDHIVAEIGSSYVNLSWRVPKDNGGAAIIKYMVYRDGEFMASVVLTWYNDTNIIKGMNYTYQVSAVNSAGEGHMSDKIHVTPAEPPGAPQNLTYKMGREYVNLSWGPPGDDGGVPIRKYCIYRNGNFIGEVSPSHLWYNDTPLSYGTYMYSVVACNDIGMGNQSQITVHLREGYGEVMKICNTGIFAWWWLLVVGIVIVGIALVLLTFHRGSKDKESNDGMIELTCPSCGYTAKVPEDYRGKFVQCPSCGKKFRVE